MKTESVVNLRLTYHFDRTALIAGMGAFW